MLRGFQSGNYTSVIRNEEKIHLQKDCHLQQYFMMDKRRIQTQNLQK